jgi:DNA-binding GntR family transcriptional regulator
MAVQKTSVRDLVRRTLTERILTGHYRSGDRLIELQIARELGTSQGSVREALRELEASRLVESEPNRGTRVRTVGRREIREAYLVRGLLEQAAAPTAVAGLHDKVDDLRGVIAGILQASDARNYSEQAAQVYSFHRSVMEASGNATLLRLWESLAFETWVRIRLGWGPIDREQAEISYAAILGALEHGDGAEVGRLLRKHAETFAPPAENELELIESQSGSEESGH